MLRTSLARTAARGAVVAQLTATATSAGLCIGPVAARTLRTRAGVDGNGQSSSSQATASSSRTASSRGISGSATASALASATSVPSPADRDAAFLRSVSVGDPQGVLATSLQDALVHTPLCYVHPSTKGAEFPPRSLVPLSSHVFGIAPRSDILHSAVVYYLDSIRAGTASTKTRGEVAYSGRKLRPQKGSGQARLGSRGNPLLRGGGVAHGPKPRDFSTKLPRRVRELALRSALSARWKSNDLHVVPSFGGVSPPPSITGPMRRLLGSKGWDRALFLTAPRSPTAPARTYITTARPSAADPVYTPEQLTAHETLIANFKKAVGNIPNTEVIELEKLPQEAVRRMLERKGRRAAMETAKRPGELHAYQVLRYPKLICDLGAIEWLEEKLGGAAWHNLEDASFMSDAESSLVGSSGGAVDEDFAPGTETTISELEDKAGGEGQADLAAEEAELQRKADKILQSAGIDVSAGRGESGSKPSQ
ncbi:unnamed protein product [Tilletia controversa]|uniref:Large ribosomal subunit protein uL4m n=3 Tax=Tilletia TaxID=13289 RepID=A0A8X7MPE9_9BASI|nr:hypothetical protein CF336_g4603 [Tilletia laevis]KAE8196103.1 hypothetical protein CF328_g4236 [Tilletia controversa]KAE8261177.1 hypothetical protein A4X03_0g3484 [Tilletia caries]KAE8201401.1 hypothetical protein CF335_g3748 [Tilletia laevis]KAE8243201.1 hypothetical protein A4X06_0g6480 [Tilletia controversa]